MILKKRDDIIDKLNGLRDRRSSTVDIRIGAFTDDERLITSAQIDEGNLITLIKQHKVYIISLIRHDMREKGLKNEARRL